MSRPGKDKGKGGIRTLSDLNSRGDGSDSDSDNPQEYYTGGEKSGMLVQDPAKGNRDVDAIFERARSVGAQQGPFEVPQAPSSSRNIFSGTAHTLEGNVRDQNPVTQASRQEPVLRTITFWRNGFTVDDGPLRRLDDPANASFLSSISKSECPKELEPADHRSPVHVNLVRRDEDWQPPPEPKHVPFKGIGRALGSSSTADGPTQPARPVNNSVVQGLTVNASEPVTSIQIRLSDGTRMVSKFNHYHTIADIRGFINAARPGSTHDYQLQVMGFPPKILSDPSQTIEQAGLLNAVIIQKS